MGLAATQKEVEQRPAGDDKRKLEKEKEEMKIICLCAYRDASLYLPAFISCLKPYVDGFMFLNDREDNPDYSLRVIRVAADGLLLAHIERSQLANEDPFAFETRNRTILLNEALAEGADYMLCLDADERLEVNFLKQMREWLSMHTEVSLWAQVRDLWNSPRQYRIDGPWSKKQKPVMFPARSVRERQYHEGNVLHRSWLGYEIKGSGTTAVYNLYHLGSLTPELRQQRVRQHEIADPEHRWQKDYTYLADETGLQVEKIPDGRGWQ